MINLDKLIKEAYPNSTFILKLCMNHRGSQAQHHHDNAELELERQELEVFAGDFLEANDPTEEDQWDKKIYKDGAPTKYKRMKDFCKMLQLYVTDANDPPPKEAMGSGKRTRIETLIQFKLRRSRTCKMKRQTPLARRSRGPGGPSGPGRPL